MKVSDVIREIDELKNGIKELESIYARTDDDHKKDIENKLIFKRKMIQYYLDYEVRV